MRNIEIKIRVSNKNGMISRLEKLGAEFEYTMKQCDYYFEIGEDKTKLRVIDDSEFQLITYQRTEKHGRKDSFYEIKTLSSDEKDSLLKSRKVVKQVEKTRELWLYGNTRIHIDQVETLGDFLELETVIKDISLDSGESEFKAVINGLGINPDESVPASYSDLVPAFA
jgi:predicted adenylyl cyclase CyaB